MENKTRAVRVSVAAAKPAAEVDPGEVLLFEGVDKSGEQINLGSATDVTFINSRLSGATLVFNGKKRPNIHLVGTDAPGLSLASSTGPRHVGLFLVEKSDLSRADLSDLQGEISLIQGTRIERINLNRVRGYLTITKATGENADLSYSDFELSITQSEVPGIAAVEAAISNGHLCGKSRAPRAALRKSTFNGMCFTTGLLPEADLRDGQGDRTVWIETSAPGLQAQGLKLTRAHVHESDWTGMQTDERSDFSGSELIWAKLGGVNTSHLAGTSITSDKGMPFMRVSRRMLVNPELVKTLKDARGESLDDLRRRAEKRGIDLPDFGLGE